jgi:uncharacterized protein YybS (DUF2232 family)
MVNRNTSVVFNDKAAFLGESQRKSFLFPVTALSQIRVYTTKNQYMHSLPVLVMLIGTHNTCSFVLKDLLSFMKT